jgi:ketosteroid isomerase-like protein
MRTRPALACLAASALLCACRTSPAPAPPASPPPAPAVDAEAERLEIAKVLTDWHQAASVPDGARYFGHMAAEAVFLGTDAGERWTLPAFRAFCEPYFARGVGWTYSARERHVFVQGDVAWFDEKLWNDKYGECRGTGALEKRGGEWKIVHYSLTLLIPNERAADVVALLRKG